MHIIHQILLRLSQLCCSISVVHVCAKHKLRHRPATVDGLTTACSPIAVQCVATSAAAAERPLRVGTRLLTVVSVCSALIDVYKERLYQNITPDGNHI